MLLRPEQRHRVSPLQNCGADRLEARLGAIDCCAATASVEIAQECGDVERDLPELLHELLDTQVSQS